MDRSYRSEKNYSPILQTTKKPSARSATNTSSRDNTPNPTERFAHSLKKNQSEVITTHDIYFNSLKESKEEDQQHKELEEDIPDLRNGVNPHRDNTTKDKKDSSNSNGNIIQANNVGKEVVERIDSLEIVVFELKTK